MTARPLIAHVVNSLEAGGLENGVVNLVNDSRDSFRHVIICMTTEGSFRTRLNSGVEVVAIGKRTGKDVRALGRLIVLLRQLRPAVVHSRNWATFDAVVAARVARAPAVVHGEHGRDISDPQGRNPRRRRLRRAFAPLVDRFVAVSEDLHRWLVEDIRIPARKVVTIRNGVELSRFGTVSRAEARWRLGIAADRLVVGTVGRLDPVKDQAGLLDAFSRSRPRHPDTILVIAGAGPCRAQLESLIAHLALKDRVLLLGERRDIPEILMAFDVFALPSVAEGMSNTILEAMATGLPVIATRVGGSPELVEDGVTGRLVPPRDSAELADAIDRYLEDGHLRDLHGKTARQRAVEHFDLSRMARDYADLYSTLVGERTIGGA